MSAEAANHIQLRIGQVRALIPDVRAVADKRVNMQHGRGGAGCPSPINLAAYDLLNCVGDLGLTLVRAAGLVVGRDVWEQLDRQTVAYALAEREDVDWICGWLDGARVQLDRFLDPASCRRYVGVCPQCGWGVWIAESSSVSGSMRCRMCDRMLDLRDVAEAHKYRLLLSDHADTLRHLRDLLNACGYHVSLHTMRTWSKRGRIHPCGEQDDGQPVYRIGEVLMAIRNRGKHISSE